MAPFRFAVQLSNASSGASWRELARTIEGLGYSTLFIPDHFEDQFGPLVALTVAAEATTELNVGSLVFGNDYRHPIVLAKEVATLDLMSEGRVEFGLGAGWMTTDYDQSGIPNDPPGVRISRMAESLEIMKSLWSTGAATLAGEHYTITGAVGAPLPHSRPHPKIIIGGGGKRVLGIAAREADIVGVNPSLAAGYVGAEVLETTTAEYYDQRIGWIREAAGDRFDELELQVLDVPGPDRARPRGRHRAPLVDDGGDGRADRRNAHRPHRDHRADHRAPDRAPGALRLLVRGRARGGDGGVRPGGGGPGRHLR